jgi:outer membrane protein assembly factor BamE (lipoprotein component of BamABCDE complex)
MKNLFAFILMLTLTAGCGVPRNIAAEQNKANLTRLAVDMTPDEVLAVMGRPHSTETREGIDYWYYLTESDDLIAPEAIDRWHMTPLAFKHGRLIGYGRDFLPDSLPTKSKITMKQGPLDE